MDTQEFSDRLALFAQATEQAAKVTAQEVANGITALAPVLEQVWQQCMANEAIWQERIDGPVYRQTFLLGRFRWYRQFRVWLLRRGLKSR